MLVNVGSQSVTVENGMRWSLNTLSIKMWAMLEAVYGWAREIKWAYLDSLSTTTIITLQPWDSGSPSIKSIEMSCHTLVGIGKG